MARGGDKDQRRREQWRRQVFKPLTLPCDLSLSIFWRLFSSPSSSSSSSSSGSSSSSSSSSLSPFSSWTWATIQIKCNCYLRNLLLETCKSTLLSELVLQRTVTWSTIPDGCRRVAMMVSSYTYEWMTGVRLYLVVLLVAKPRSLTFLGVHSLPLSPQRRETGGGAEWLPGSSLPQAEGFWHWCNRTPTGVGCSI